ncbi:MAG: alpha/beta hydrolase [Gammaproteobacteria bacterium]
MPTVQINGHSMYYEIHGQGEPALCMGGWGTYCHGGERHLARGLTDNYQVLIIDYRGIGESTDDPAQAPTMVLHATDVIGLLDHLGWSRVHVVGLVGMGACIAQEVAIRRPDLVRSMVNMGAWASVDPFLYGQLEMFRDVHRDSGFLTFQKHVCLMSFLPDYYNHNRERLLGLHGPWSELNGRYPAHERLVAACLDHDVTTRLHLVSAPSLIIHAGQDQVTGPRTTLPLEHGIPNAQGLHLEHFAHVVAGREQKAAFSRSLLDFLGRH